MLLTALSFSLTTTSGTDFLSPNSWPSDLLLLAGDVIWSSRRSVISLIKLTLLLFLGLTALHVSYFCWLLLPFEVAREEVGLSIEINHLPALSLKPTELLSDTNRALKKVGQFAIWRKETGGKIATKIRLWKKSWTICNLEKRDGSDCDTNRALWKKSWTLCNLEKIDGSDCDTNQPLKKVGQFGEKRRGVRVWPGAAGEVGGV